ncbi:hypothetical protein M0638_07115 [Roseomonas sp. NAR14]|uniref:Twin-arginine translocation pathway signal n=1 Tax=Roseomonas acroporae TaxID=2937791 RepID=A0A9X1Y8E3_9PROT|nr:hypothetical protein [Roseomonas acroporae]MCK8784145.1 hypothetical protein [Roseomonas acroporae]
MSGTLSRRGLLRVPALAALPTAAPGAAAMDADRALLTLCASWQAAVDAADSFYARHVSAMPPDQQGEAEARHDAEMGRLDGTVWDIEDRIAVTPAHTFAGLVAKARVFRGTMPSSSAELLVADILRLGGVA